MPSYRILWIIDIDADSPSHAAKKAREIQQDPDSTATVFDVCTPTGQRVASIDLSLLNAEPTHCPFCGSNNVTFVNTWRAYVTDPADAANTTELDEHQCRNESCGRSFWS